MLHHYDGLPLGEIAEILGVPYGTVGSRLHHATRALRAVHRGRGTIRRRGRTAGITATFDFDQLLESVLGDSGSKSAPADIVEAALVQARDVPQRRPHLNALDRRAWPAPRLSLADPAGARLATVGIVALLALALVAATLFIGSLLTPLPPPLPGAWIQTSQLNTRRDSGVVSFGMAVLPDGRILFIGGAGPDPASAEVFDPATNTFAPTADQLPTTPGDATAVTLQTGAVLVFGDGSSATFDPVAGSFAQATPMTADRVFQTTTLLEDGRVLVVGGSGPGGAATLASAEVYDPDIGSWSQVGSMSTPRQQHVATLLADGRVLITGGTNDSDTGWPALTAEVFDPATGSFSPAGAMSGGRTAHTATVLPDGARSSAPSGRTPRTAPSRASGSATGHRAAACRPA